MSAIPDRARPVRRGTDNTPVRVQARRRPAVRVARRPGRFRPFANVNANGASSSIGVNLNIQDSLVTGNTASGVSATTGSGLAPVNVSLTGTQVSGNFGAGLRADATGGSAIIRVGASMISANAAGITTTGVGQVRSFGNNQVNSNGGGEAFTATDLLK